MQLTNYLLYIREERDLLLIGIVSSVWQWIFDKAKLQKDLSFRDRSDLTSLSGNKTRLSLQRMSGSLMLTLNMESRFQNSDDTLWFPSRPILIILVKLPRSCLYFRFKRQRSYSFPWMIGHLHKCRTMWNLWDWPQCTRASVGRLLGPEVPRTTARALLPR
jgi:hypothetical protein